LVTARTVSNILSLRFVGLKGCDVSSPGKKVPDVSNDHSAFIFRLKQFKNHFFGLLAQKMKAL